MAQEIKSLQTQAENVQKDIDRLLEEKALEEQKYFEAELKLKEAKKKMEESMKANEQTAYEQLKTSMREAALLKRANEQKAMEKSWEESLTMLKDQKEMLYKEQTEARDEKKKLQDIKVRLRSSGCAEFQTYTPSDLGTSPPQQPIVPQSSFSLEQREGRGSELAESEEEVSGGDADAGTPMAGDAAAGTPMAGGESPRALKGGEAPVSSLGGEPLGTPVEGGALVTPIGGDALVTPIGGDALVTPIGGDALVTPIDGDALVTPINGADGERQEPGVGGLNEAELAEVEEAMGKERTLSRSLDENALREMADEIIKKTEKGELNLNEPIPAM